MRNISQRLNLLPDVEILPDQRNHAKGNGRQAKNMVSEACRWNLFCEGVAVGFSPGAVAGNGLHWRAALRSARARTCHFGLGHAKAGFVFQAGADVDGPVLRGLALQVTNQRRILVAVLRTAARRDENHQRQQR